MKPKKKKPAAQNVRLSAEERKGDKRITTVIINKRTGHIERKQHKDTAVEEQADLANDAGFEAIWIGQERRIKELETPKVS